MIHPDELAVAAGCGAAVSLAVPVGAWWLQRAGYINSRTQRYVEMAWLLSLTMLVAAAWGVLALRLSPYDRQGLWLAGYSIVVVCFSVVVPATHAWREERCVTGLSLLMALFWAAFRLAIFYPCMILAFIILSILLYGGPVHFSVFDREPLFAITVLVAIGINLGTPVLVRGCLSCYRSFHREFRLEQQLVQQLRAKPRPVEDLARRKILERLRKEAGSPAIDESCIEIESCKPTRHRGWHVRGVICEPGDALHTPTRAWQAFLEVSFGELKFKYLVLEEQPERVETVSQKKKSGIA